MKISKLVKSQSKSFEIGGAGNLNEIVCTVEGIDYRRVKAVVRFDDQCGNGHNSFSITGEAWYTGERAYRGEAHTSGCIHEIIAVAFPELKPFIKFHLMSSDSPMHYIANTLYHARDCDTAGANVGDPIKFARYVFLGNSEYPHNFKSKFTDWLELAQKSGWIFVPKAIAHKKDSNYDFADQYTIEGFDCEWYECPFDNKLTAEGFCNTISKHGFAIVNKPIAWAKAVTPNLEAARNSACWSDATIEQLQSKELLEGRLPMLILQLANAVEELGMEF